MKYCPDCGSTDIYDYPLEGHESWYYCQACKTVFGEVVYVPKDEFAALLEEEGYPKDAAKVRAGQRLSDNGE